VIEEQGMSLQEDHSELRLPEVEDPRSSKSFNEIQFIVRREMF